MAKNSKKKGNRGENELVHLLCEAFGEGKFKRTPSSGAHTGGQNRESAANLPWEAKITLVSDIITPTNFNFVIEHKFYKEVNFWDIFSEKSDWNDWISQVEEDASFVQKEPLLVVKYNRHERLAFIKSEYLLKQLEKYNKTIKPMLFWLPFNREYTYSVVFFSELLKLPKDFWFSGESK